MIVADIALALLPSLKLKHVDSMRLAYADRPDKHTSAVAISKRKEDVYPWIKPEAISAATREVIVKSEKGWIPVSGKHTDEKARTREGTSKYSFFMPKYSYLAYPCTRDACYWSWIGEREQAPCQEAYTSHRPSIAHSDQSFGLQLTGLARNWVRVFMTDRLWIKARGHCHRGRPEEESPGNRVTVANIG